MAAFLVSFFLISRSYVRSQAAPVVQVTLTREAVLDLPMYLSSRENSSIVLQVQGVFANALSVYMHIFRRVKTVLLFRKVQGVLANALSVPHAYNI